MKSTAAYISVQNVNVMWYNCVGTFRADNYHRQNPWSHLLNPMPTQHAYQLNVPSFIFIIIRISTSQAKIHKSNQFTVLFPWETRHTGGASAVRKDKTA